MTSRSKITVGGFGPHPVRSHASAKRGLPESWLLSVTSRSGHCAWPDALTSPKPPDGPGALWTALSPSSDSHHDLGTAVGLIPGRLYGSWMMQA
jgi:hypothetical protein